MSEPLIIRNTISIKATPEKVWDALTNPAETKKYMYGCEALSDWKAGSPLIWKGNFDGVELVAVTGHIVNIEPGKFLAYTTFDPNGTIADLPENYLTVTYSLSAENGETVLTVTQGDYNKVAEGERRYNEGVAGGGWGPIVEQIKKQVEVV